MKRNTKSSAGKAGTTLGRTMPTITTTNFFDVVNADVLASAPQAIKEGYDLALSLKNDGIDPFASGDSDIDETMQLMIDKLNSHVNSSNIMPQNDVPKSESKTQKHASAPKKSNTPKKVVAEPSKEVATKRANTVKSNVSARKSNKAAKPKRKPVAVKNTGKTKVKVVYQKPPKAPVTVKKLSKELQVMKAFVAMNGKKYKAKYFENRYADLHNFIPNASDHKSILNEIETRLEKAVNVIKKDKLDEISIRIEPDFIAKCQDKIKNAKVRIRTEFLSGTSRKSVFSKKIVDAVVHVSNLREADKQAEAQKYYAKLTAKEKEDFWNQFKVVNTYDTDGIPMSTIVAEWKRWLSAKKHKRTTK